jgi:hypothetical protein
LGVLLFATITACAARDGFRLIHPPAAPDDQFPGGYRLLVKAPLGEWPVDARFASLEACERAKRAATDSAIAQAHARLGNQAKNDLGVRRSVHARCVRRARLETPER